jgi:hypothetical protein
LRESKTPIFQPLAIRMRRRKALQKVSRKHPSRLIYRRGRLFQQTVFVHFANVTQTFLLIDARVHPRAVPA